MNLEKDLLNIDFASLLTLTLVHRLRSFSKAAAELDVKQSTISYTIDRLRRALNDPLFVRQGGGIACTERCVEAVRFAEEVLAGADRFATGAAFDPSIAEGTITITTGFLVQTAILPAVTQRLRREAKGLKLRVDPPHQVDAALFDRNADLVIMPVAFEGNGVYRQHLFSDREVALMDPQNALSHSELTLEAYAAADHVSFELGNVPGFKQAWIPRLQELGITPNIFATTYDGFMVSHYVRGTDLIATMASRSARVFAGPELVLRNIPLEIDVEVNMYWTAAADRSPLNAWLRQVIIDVAQSLEPSWRADPPPKNDRSAREKNLGQ